LTTDFFLGSCLELVQRTAIAYDPRADAALDDGQQRKSAKPGRRRATKTGDGRLRAKNTHLRDTTAGTLRETKEIQSWEAERVRHAAKRLQQYAKERAAAARAA